MRALLLITLLASCGKDNKTGHVVQVHREQYSVIAEEHVSTPLEAHGVLHLAATRAELDKYNGTKWYTHRGQYLFRSIVTGARSYRLE